MDAHQSRAIVRALAFKRSDRTPSVRRFLAELSGSHRLDGLKDLAWLSATLAAAIVVVVFAAHFHRSPPPVNRIASQSGRAPRAGIRDFPTCPLIMGLPAGPLHPRSRR